MENTHPEVGATGTAEEAVTEAPIAARAPVLDELLGQAPTSAFVARRFGVITDRMPFRLGRGSAEAVARSLASLSADWQVLHGVPIGCDHRVVDHLLIGPPGVFTLNVEDHRGSEVRIHGPWIEADGHQTARLHTSRLEADRAASLLTRACGFVVPVRPVIVLLAETFLVIGDTDGVAVLSAPQVTSWLTDRPERLAPTEVCAVYGQARRASLWR
jgi:hypothetical protein